MLRFSRFLLLAAPLSALLPVLAALLAFAAPDVAAKSVRTDYVESELIARHGSAEPGGKLLIGLRLKMDAHWHTYWQNPGDSGMPTTIQWKLPAGFKAGPIQWPLPQRLPIPPLMNYGYEGEIVLPVELSVPKDWPTGLPGQPARIAARADWLVCKDVCLPGGADLELTLPVINANPAPDAKWAALFDKSLAAIPTQSIKGASATTSAGMIELTLPGVKPAGPGKLYVFSGIEGLVEHAAPQSTKITSDGSTISFPVSHQLSASEPRISGVVTGAGAQPLLFAAPMTGKLVPGKEMATVSVLSKPVAPSETDSLTFGLALVFAFIGGLILNLMPCVFPVLWLKILGFAQDSTRATMRTQGIAFAVGVIASFVALAAVLLALRSAGEAIGWGFQLQSPLVVTLLALLFFIIGLNLSGVFEFGNVLPGGLAAKSLKNPIADALFSGVLAALVASPCTAPFMGAALGFALTQSTFAALLVFAVMGAGMALPYVLLSFFPAWLKRLPRPGLWLETFKEVMAFPMYATVVWLAWVLLVQVGVDGLVWFGSALVLVSFGAWLLGKSHNGIGRISALGAILVAFYVANPPAPTVSGDGIRSNSTVASTTSWEAYSKTRIAELNAAGKPVFVDFTAAWCITCQVNKKVVLETQTVRDAFAAKNLNLMRADWTKRDAAITAALAEFGRNAVPVYALYVPGKAPVLLPEILTERIVLDALKSL